MKPKMNDKKCGAVESSCKAIKACPTQAIRYIEVKEAITDRNVNCISDSGGCGCDCGTSKSSCNGSPYARIVIDLDKCIECGICAEECCGKAIDMV